MMNKRGQLAFLGVMLFMMMFIAIVALIDPLKDQIALARDPDHLDCANSSISVGQQMSCIVVDWTFIAFIGVGIGCALGYIGLRNLQNTGGGGGSLQ